MAGQIKLQSQTQASEAKKGLFWGLPLKDGLTVLEELRGQGADLPIIILSARDRINDKVAGLEGGADDYVTKPFRFEELLARIRLRLRTHQTTSSVKPATVLKIGQTTYLN